MSTFNTLDPLRFPLHGSALIEASAGTGKTFTLALLYLRLILRHGGEQAFSTHLTPPEILVVTFTKAATRELRDRIRRRLVEAAALFRGELADTEVDPQLCQLRDEVALEESLGAAARRLDAAAEWMDEAAVSTIHAWCYQVLKEHAFSSGHAFEQTLLESEHELIEQACADYWRTFYLGLEREALTEVLQHCADPRVLYQQVQPLLEQIEALPPAPAAPAELLDECLRRRRELLAQLKAACRNWVPTLRDLFDDAADRKLLKSGRPHTNHRNGIFDALLAWSDSDTTQPSCDLSSTTGQQLALVETGNWKDEADLPEDRSAAEALAALPEQLDALPDPAIDLLLHAVYWVRQRLDGAKAQHALLSNNDLLTRLDEALRGPRGEQLAAVIRRQYPLALVDEFQDTDPVQYRIFDAIYRVQQPHPDTGFFMIGDPKQAIYAFRGADIYTYLQARRDTAGRHYTLAQNFRSAPALIAAVNGLFKAAEQHEAGAFRFRTPDDNPVPFGAVSAGNKAPNQLLIDGGPVAAQQVWLHNDPDVGKGGYVDIMSAACADEITRLLTLAQQGRAGLQLKGDPRPLRPGDIAILVNGKREADAVRDALFERQVPSVYLSDASSVYATGVAQQLLQLLKAVASPYDDRQLRAALATELLGWDLLQLDALNADERIWEAQVERFQRYHQCWRRQGVLALIHRLISEFDVAPRLLARPRGERDLTDLLHLAELLQSAADQLDGEQALIRFLQEAQADPDQQNEAQQQRLESDSELVQVVTIHKSKGLQYPLVFLPFACNFRSVKPSDRPLKRHDAQGVLQLGLTGSEEEVAAADRERQAEDIRKLYVALTRAVCCNWLGLAPIPELARSALGLLLDTDGAGLAARVDALAPHLQRVALPAPADPYRPTQTRQWQPARTPAELKLLPWWIASYSSLAFGQLSDPLAADTSSDAADTARDDQAGELQSEPNEAVSATPVSSVGLLHQMPRGSDNGTFMHGLLEWAAAQRVQTADGHWLHGFAAAAASESLRLEMLSARCQRRNMQAWVQPLSDWLQRFLTQRWNLNALALDDGRVPEFALADLAPRQVAVEMEFLFEARGVSSQRLDRLVTAQTWAGAPRPMALPSYLQGMLKGFIDLVLEHDGRYYVVDWKSNYLGPGDADYSREAMREALLKKRYDLQYVIYLLALHRQLKARLPGYDYDRHIGGVVYVFLRGSEHPDSQGLLMDKPPRALIEQLDLLFAADDETQEERRA